MTQTTLNRRRALAAVAAAPAAIVLGPVPAFVTAEPGHLAVLVRRYFAELDAFNAELPQDDEVFLGDQPFDKTVRELIGVPVCNDRDALAAVEWIIRDGEFLMIELGGEDLYGQVAGSLIHALRQYLAGRLA